MFGPGVSTMPSATTVTPRIPLSSTMKIPHSLFTVRCSLFAAFAYGLGQVVRDVVEEVTGEEADGEPRVGQARIVAVPVGGCERGQAAGQGLGGPPQLLRHL